MDPRSNRADVRNPVLGLASVGRLQALPPDVRRDLAAVLMDLRREAQGLADKSWKTHKAPMAAYWKAVAVYAGHTARAIRDGGRT